MRIWTRRTDGSGFVMGFAVTKLGWNASERRDRQRIDGLPIYQDTCGFATLQQFSVLWAMDFHGEKSEVCFGKLIGEY
jgi:hypothetical protein